MYFKVTLFWYTLLGFTEILTDDILLLNPIFNLLATMAFLLIRKKCIVLLITKKCIVLMSKFSLLFCQNPSETPCMQNLTMYDCFYGFLHIFLYSHISFNIKYIFLSCILNSASDKYLCTYIGKCNYYSLRLLKYIFVR